MKTQKRLLALLVCVGMLFVLSCLSLPLCQQSWKYMHLADAELTWTRE